MTAAERADAARERKRRAHEKACQALLEEVDAEIYGKVTFHMQAGLIVRAEVNTTKKFEEG